MADRGELGGIPAAAAAAGRAGPRRGLRTWHDHRGPGGPGPGRGRDRNRRGRGGTGAGAAGGGAARPGQRPVRDRGRVPAGLSGRDVRRGARAPGAPAPDRPDRGAAGDAPGLPARRDRRGTGRRLRRILLVPRGAGDDRVAGAVPGRGPGHRRGAGRGPAPAGLGPAGRLRLGRGLGQRVVLHRGRRSDLVGQVMGGPADEIAVRRPGGRARPGYARGPSAAGQGLAAVGGQRGRLAPHPARRDSGSGVAASDRASRTTRTAGLRSPPRRLTVKTRRVTGSAGGTSRTRGGSHRAASPGTRVTPAPAATRLSRTWKSLARATTRGTKPALAQARWIISAQLVAWRGARNGWPARLASGTRPSAG